jgi:phosphoglucosamine mutase
MARQLFGTDGIRGVAGEYPLDQLTAYTFGIALGEWATQHSAQPDVVIGMDTRESGPWLAEHVAGGLKEAGATPHFAGVITTPGVAYLTKNGRFVAGLMISASHNPYHDNGLKIFDHSGYKLPDTVEEKLEERILSLREQHPKPKPSTMSAEGVLDESYLDYLAAMAPSLDGIKVAVDCGNGAASQLAPALLRRLGADVANFACEPNGKNINDNCGALHIENLQGHIEATGAEMGVSFDGDADRAIFVTHSGKVVNGDGTLFLCGLAMQQHGKLTGNGGKPLVVATVMSNLGLELALRAEGIEMLRTPVGDKYVLEEMIRRDAALGGEQSGHVIFREFATTGDGLLTALRVLGAMRASGKSLEELTAALVVYPQLLLNVRVKQKRPLGELENVQARIREAEQTFGGSGRILVRFSGTEPLARVMIEGADESIVRLHSERIADAIRAELGSDT